MLINFLVAYKPSEIVLIYSLLKIGSETLRNEIDLIENDGFAK